MIRLSALVLLVCVASMARGQSHADGTRIEQHLYGPYPMNSYKKLPLIVFNRGGNREFGKVTPWTASGFYPFVSNGFVVIASQYRGNDGGEGKEEFGGADVNDVLSIIRPTAWSFMQTTIIESI